MLQSPPKSSVPIHDLGRRLSSWVHSCRLPHFRPDNRPTCQIRGHSHEPLCDATKTIGNWRTWRQHSASFDYIRLTEQRKEWRQKVKMMTCCSCDCDDGQMIDWLIDWLKENTLCIWVFLHLQELPSLYIPIHRFSYQTQRSYKWKQMSSMNIIHAPS